MFTRATLVNPLLLANALDHHSHIGYMRLSSNGPLKDLSTSLPGNCGLLNTIGQRLIYAALPGRGVDFYPADIDLGSLIEGQVPFWVYGDHKHGRACDGCGAVCPQNVLTSAGRESLALQGINGEDVPEYIREIAYKELGLAIVGKRIRSLIKLG